MHFSTIAIFATLASLASAQTLVDIPIGSLLNGLIEVGDQAIIDLGVVTNVLGPLGCTPTQVVGFNTTVVVALPGLPLADVCLCVDVIPGAGAQACPACPVNADAVCSNVTACACACRDGFVAVADGSCQRVCESPFILNAAGTDCVLPPSALARRSKKSTLPVRNTDYVF